MLFINTLTSRRDSRVFVELITAATNELLQSVSRDEKRNKKDHANYTRPSSHDNMLFLYLDFALRITKANSLIK